MKTRYTITSNNLPVKMPFWQTITALLALDRCHAPEWLYGVLAVVFAIWWIGYLAGIHK